MTEQWIVGVDGSVASRAALQWAVRHAPDRAARLVLVHAYRIPPVERMAEAVGPSGHRPAGAAATAMHELDAAVDDLVGELDVEHRVVEGPASHVVVDAAAEADLLIVGRRGVGGRWHDTIGSVARFCVTHSSVPVVVVPADWQGAPTSAIVVGYDGSRNADAAVRWTLDFARPDDRVLVVAAIEVAPWVDATVVQHRLDDELRAEEARLRSCLDRVEPHGRFQREIVMGSAKRALGLAADPAELVVVGARGSGRIAGTILGSISTWALDAVARPLVVVPSVTPPPGATNGR